MTKFITKKDLRNIDLDSLILGISRHSKEECSHYLREKTYANIWISAIESENTEIIEAMLNKGLVDINGLYKKDNEGSMERSALSMSAFNGSLKIIKLLLRKGANIDVKSLASGGSPLFLAVFAGHQHIARYLLEKGADINITDVTGSDVIKVSDSLNTHNMSEFLRWVKDKDFPSMTLNERKAALSYYDFIEDEKEDWFDQEGLEEQDVSGRGLANQNIKSPSKKGSDMASRMSLISAAQSGDIVIAKLLLEQKFGINECYNQNGEITSAFSAAISNGHEKFVDFLIKNDADLNIRDENDYTPLMLAIQYNEYNIFGNILEAGADVTAQNFRGKTALMFCIDNKNPKFFRLLMDKAPVDLSIKDDLGNSVLDVATIMGNYTFVNHLFDKVKVDQSDIEKALGLVKSTMDSNSSGMQGYKDILDLLLEEKAKVTEPEKALKMKKEDELRICVTSLVRVAENLQSANHLVQRRDVQKMMDLINNSEIDVKSEDNSGWTAMHLAARFGSVQDITALLEKEHKINAKNNSGSSVFRQFVSGGNKDFTLFLDNQNVEFPVIMDGLKASIEFFGKNKEAYFVLGTSQIVQKFSDLDKSERVAAIQELRSSLSLVSKKLPKNVLGKINGFINELQSSKKVGSKSSEKDDDKSLSKTAKKKLKKLQKLKEANDKDNAINQKLDGVTVEIDEITLVECAYENTAQNNKHADKQGSSEEEDIAGSDDNTIVADSSLNEEDRAIFYGESDLESPKSENSNKELEDINIETEVKMSKEANSKSQDDILDQTNGSNSSLSPDAKAFVPKFTTKAEDPFMREGSTDSDDFEELSKEIQNTVHGSFDDLEEDRSNGNLRPVTSNPKADTLKNSTQNLEECKVGNSAQGSGRF